MRLGGRCGKLWMEADGSNGLQICIQRAGHGASLIRLDQLNNFKLFTV
jgi:hypothetical protein